MKPRIPVSWTAVAPALASLVVVIAACGGSADGPPAQIDSKPGTVTTSASPTPHADHAAEIDQQRLAFTPARVSIKVGQAVLIKNSESAIHTANIDGKNITGDMKKGDSTAWTARAPGEYKVTCDYHPLMRAVIIVS